MSRLNLSNKVISRGISLGLHPLSLPQDYLNVRGHVSANVRLAGKGRGGLTAVVIVIVTAQIH